MKKIVWEKWNDIPPEDFEEKKDQEVEDDSFDDGEVEEGELLFSSSLDGIYQPKYISTPIGKYKDDDNLLPTKLFDCWICHTNFDLTNGNNNTPDHVKILEQVPGVEVLKVMTRYRFFIGVGKLFSIRDVRVDIAKALCVSDSNSEDQADWAAFISAEGDSYTISEAEYSTREEYEAHLSQLKEFTNGRLFISQKV